MKRLGIFFFSLDIGIIIRTMFIIFTIVFTIINISDITRIIIIGVVNLKKKHGQCDVIISLFTKPKDAWETTHKQRKLYCNKENENPYPVYHYRGH